MPVGDIDGHPISLDDPSDVAALEALVARVVRREMDGG